MSVHQKLGIILKNKVVQKLNLENNVFTKKWSPKLILLNEKKYVYGALFSLAKAVIILNVKINLPSAMGNLCRFLVFYFVL